MDDGERIGDYIEFMRKFVRSLDRMDEQIEWINSEEGHFQFPLSVYPKVKELKEIILPYYSLIYRAYQWKRDKGVWLDGPFEYLDAVSIENRTTEYFNDFSKTSKTYRTKIDLFATLFCQERFLSQ